MYTTTARPVPLADLGETPVSINSGFRCELQTIVARNPHATDGAYVKIYESDTTPVGATVPIWAGWVPGASDRTFAIFSSGSNLWITVATEFAAGLTAPSADFQVSITIGKS